MRALMHLVTRVHFRSRDKDGSYITRSAVPEKPILHANITALCLIEQELLPIEVLHCGNRNIFDLFGSCDLDLDPMAKAFESYRLTDTSKIIYHAASRVVKNCVLPHSTFSVVRTASNFNRHTFLSKPTTVACCRC